MERTEVSSHLEKSEEAALCDSAPSSPSHPSTGASTPTLATANASPFADMLHSFIQRDDLAAVLGLQSNIMSRFEKTNEMLANCNRVATAALPEATSDLRAYASTLRTLRAELADLHRRIQLIRDALAARYPHAFPPPRSDEDELPEEGSSDEEYEAAAATSVVSTSPSVSAAAATGLTGAPDRDSRSTCTESASSSSAATGAAVAVPLVATVAAVVAAGSSGVGGPASSGSVSNAASDANVAGLAVSSSSFSAGAAADRTAAFTESGSATASFSASIRTQI